MSQSHGATLWREPAGSGAVPSVTLGHWVQVSAGIYELCFTGPDDAVLQSDGGGGYDLIAGGVPTGRVAIIRGTIGEIY